MELEHQAHEQQRKQEWWVKMKELELHEKELQMKDKEMQLQLKLKELELQMTSSPSESPPFTSTSFDVSRQVRLVPQFHKEEMDKFFLHFEKEATTLHWPLELCIMLLQSVLLCKAHEVYLALSVEHSANYEVVKREILIAYELIPKGYCQQFCEMKSKKRQTYMEFAHQREVLFNRWCKLVIGLKGLNSSSF